MSFSGKKVLVTGGSRGIGRAVVEGFARQGAKVAFVYHSNEEAAQDVITALAGEGFETVTAHKCDVSKQEEVDALVEKLVEEWDGLDILVNNAGIVKDGLLATMDGNAWHSVLSTNLHSVYYFCHAVTRPMMSQRSGRVINMSSVAAEFPNQGQANYAASKGGIQGLTRCMATELGRRGITVNAVAPGFIETDMTVAVRNAAESEIKKSIPLRRLGRPEDIADAVMFLAGDNASYITGQIITVDGGLTLGGI
ncbi:3-oxoacyl-[acyl-carrier-protein] reductase [Rubinisphaera brasiliensis]|uniref:3-oxoacyl-[acyl-carrier-protein] reductase n=1 Tax=Rubinisphaera brasiliensis (strain ATCC 49424 / DSM 5305 / JCM 21570 / IAM 15109 / NBRC 103401 / IFAM 1448) TaxID=756272 RepID=F0SGD4_RUBBR|nr:3-oxoacyl-[acyl-carrier-protein] reductase [Rubinisphaera brasiliensis]ADY60533.1 3-oxoacyl-(acyl-carrier-protein) reductase [Rubinisphaera brasiliensis DSM 5305]